MHFVGLILMWRGMKSMASVLGGMIKLKGTGGQGNSQKGDINMACLMDSTVLTRLIKIW